MQWIELYPPIRIRRFFPRNKTGEIGRHVRGAIAAIRDRVLAEAVAL